jgi:hypothetical protein
VQFEICDALSSATSGFPSSVVEWRPDYGGAFDPANEFIRLLGAIRARLTFKILDVTDLVMLARDVH